jgi:hypothetical protein
MDRYVARARIVLLTKSSSNPLSLTADFYAACDPDISFDGKYIIFAGKKNPSDRWQIWKMRNDGTEKRQITKSEGDCIMPVYAGNRFYLNDPEPTPQIIYAGTTGSRKVSPESEPVLALYGTDPEGQKTHRLSFNLYSDYSPDVLPNGRIVFSSWQPFSEQKTIGKKLALMAINNDGTDLMPYYGNHEQPVFKEMVHISDTGPYLYYIETDTVQWLGGGDIAFLSQKRPLNSYQIISKTKNGRYHSPCPIPDSGLLASFRLNTPGDVFTIYGIDTENGLKEDQIFRDDQWHSIDIHILEAHPKVKGRSNWLIPGSVNGVFYCLNSYHTDLPQIQNVADGEIKYVRLIEGIRRGNSNFVQNSPEQTDFYPGSWPIIKRILGTAPVEKDGSFQIRVPAETPLNFQLLDKNYITIRRQESWTWVMGNENRGCIGCHENKELAPPNKLVDAVIKSPVDLNATADERRSVDFRHHIAPLIKSKCATRNCHVSGKTRPYLEEKLHSDGEIDSDTVYKTLLGLQNFTKDVPYVVPGYAGESPLVWYWFSEKLYSKQVVYHDTVAIMPPEKLLTRKEKILFIEWIDLGAQWDAGLYKMSSTKDTE